MTDEVWKIINGFPNYQVSNLGRIKRTAFYKRCLKGQSDSEIRLLHNELILKPYDSGNGYLKVNLTKDRKKYSKFIHRLVAEHFVEKSSDTCTIVNHKDYDKRNNIAQNLEWCTQKYNINYSKMNMKKQHNTKAGKTNIRYLTKRKNGLYRVNICNSRIVTDKSFSSFDEAIKYRNEVLNEISYTE